MSARRLGFAALAVIIGVAAWILFGSQQDGERDPAAGAGNTRAATEQSERQPPPAAATGDALTRSGREAPAPESAAPPFLPPSDHPDAVAVRVVDARTREPVAGAEVLALPNDRDTGDVHLRVWGPDYRFEEVFERYGDRHRTGADGSVRIAPARVACRLIARTESSFAEGEFRMDEVDGPVTLALKPRIDLSVRVVHPDGSPVPDVPVVYQVENVERGWARNFRKAYTREDGVAPFPNLRQTVESVRQMTNGRGTARLVVAVPLDGMVSSTFDPENPPEEDVVLTVPPLGKLRVELLDWEGRPVQEEFTVTVYRPDPQEDEEANAYGPASMAWRDARPTSGGTVSFPIGLGQRIALTCGFGRGSERVTRIVRGPTTPGGTVNATLQQREAPSVLVAQVLGPDGEPLTNVDVDLIVRYYDEPEGDSGRPLRRSQHPLPQTTDARGRLRLFASDPDRRDLDWHFLEVGHRLSDQPSQVWVGSVDLTPLGGLGPGDNDVGSVRVGGPGALATGRVLAPDGAPLAGATVRYRWHAAMDRDHAHTNYRNAATTGPDGGFAFLGSLPAVQLTLEVTHDDYRALRVEVEPGARGIEIVMPESGALVGRVLLDAELPLGQAGAFTEESPVELRLERAEDDPERPWSGRGREEITAADQPFRFPGLEPGDYRLRVVSDPSHEDLALVDGLRVDGGEACKDPRLNALDLRGALSAHRLHVLAADGEDVPHLRVVPQDGRGRAWDGENPVQIVSVREPLTLRVDAPGYRGTEVTLTDREHDVTLSRGIVATFTHELSEEELDGRRLSLTATTEAPGARRTCAGRFGGDGKCTLHLSWPGEYRITLTARRGVPDDQGSKDVAEETVPLAGEASMMIQVAAGADGQEITLPLNPNELVFDDGKER